MSLPDQHVLNVQPLFLSRTKAPLAPFAPSNFAEKFARNIRLRAQNQTAP
jgi:hypothetical protein